MMRFGIGIVFAFALLPLAHAADVSPAPVLGCLPCAPDQCLGAPNIAELRAEKKAALIKAGYPARVAELVDRVAPCVSCLSSVPASFRIMTVALDDSVSTRPYSTYLERRAREQLAAARIKQLYIVSSPEACACCAEKGAHERPDWNASVGINTGVALAFPDAASLGPMPADLKSAPSGDTGTPTMPAVPPPLPRVSSQCPECEEAGKEVNNAGFALAGLEERIARASLLFEVERRALSAANFENAEHPGIASSRQAEARIKPFEEAALVLDDLRAQRAAQETALEAARRRFAGCQSDRCNTRRFAFEVAGGANFGLLQNNFDGVSMDSTSQTQIQGGVRVGARMLVTPDRHGAITLSLSVFQGDLQTVFMVPVGFQYEVRLPVPGLFIYGRASVGYGAQVFAEVKGIGRAGHTVSSFLAVPEIGIGYYFAKMFSVGIEPLSFPIFINDTVAGNVEVTYRPMLFFGYHPF